MAGPGLETLLKLNAYGGGPLVAEALLELCGLNQESAHAEAGSALDPGIADRLRLLLALQIAPRERTRPTGWSWGFFNN